MRGTFRAWSAVVALATLLAASVSLTGCAEEEKPPSLPSLSPSTATPTSTAGLSDEEQIRWIYEGYARGLHKAERIEDDDERREYLSQWLTDPALSDRVKGAAEFRRLGYRTEGTPVPHVARAKISDQTGKVHGCTDEGPLITTNTKTGKRTRGSGIWRVFDLRRTTDGWRIYAVDVGQKLCDPDKY